MPRLQKLDPEKLTTCHNKKLSYAKLRYFYEVDKNNTLQVVTALERWMKAIIVKMSTSTVLTDEFHGHWLFRKEIEAMGLKEHGFEFGWLLHQNDPQEKDPMDLATKIRF